MKPRHLLCAVLALTALFLVVLARLAPPSPLPADASAERFSAGRAAQILHELVGDGVPHPVGSEANARVRERILEKLRALGYSPETQSELVCGQYGVCANVVNVIARPLSHEASPSVALLAHYDSVPAGPGAADDGSGVAILLEIARILSLEPKPSHPIALVFTDGEEAGLLGARAFVRHHPLARELRAVVNVEARGTHGPSLLFELRGDETGLIDLFARHVPHPVTSSLFSAVYERMPNDSDLSVFARHGISGVNFAFLGGVTSYHTPLDNVANLSLSTLQDHGDHALAMIRALADEPTSEAAKAGKPVYFDLLSLGVVHYDAALSLPLAALVLVGTCLLGLISLRSRRFTWGEAARGLIGTFLAPFLGFATAWGLLRVLSLVGVTRNWPAFPAPLLVTLVVTGILSVTLASSLTRSDSHAGTHAGLWLGWTALAGVMGIALPGAGYLFLVPAAVALVTSATLVWPAARMAWHAAAMLLPALVAGALWFPILALLYDAAGLMAGPALAAGTALVLTPFLPFLSALKVASTRRLTVTSTVTAMAGVTVTALAPAASAHVPERLSLTFHQDSETKTARWLAQPESGLLPASLRQALPFGARMTPALPWSHAQAFVAPAPSLPLAPPEVTIHERAVVSGERHIAFHVKPSKAHATLLLAFPEEAAPRLTIEGEPATGRREARSTTFTLKGTPAEGVEISAKLRGSRPVQMTVVSAWSGLPEEAGALVLARPNEAVPTQEGDMTMVSGGVGL